MVKKYKFFRKIIVNFTLLFVLIFGPKISTNKSVRYLSKENQLKVNLCKDSNTNFLNSDFNPIDDNNVSVPFFENFEGILKDEPQITNAQSRYIIFKAESYLLGDEEKIQAVKKKQYRPKKAKLQTMPQFLKEERERRLNELIFRIDLDDFKFILDE